MSTFHSVNIPQYQHKSDKNSLIDHTTLSRQHQGDTYRGGSTEHITVKTQIHTLRYMYNIQGDILWYVDTIHGRNNNAPRRSINIINNFTM